MLETSTTGTSQLTFRLQERQIKSSLLQVDAQQQPGNLLELHRLEIAQGTKGELLFCSCCASIRTADNSSFTCSRIDCVG